MANQTIPCEELFDEDGNGICDGQEVRVNGGHIGKVHITAEGQFSIEGWPEDEVIESLEVIEPLPINIDEVHTMIKE